MSFLMGGDAPAPQPMPLPPDPSIAEDARRRREEAATAALAESKAAGRRSTIVAGMNIAADEQAGTGLLAKARRAEARSLVG